jgi:hypothetical protein
MDAKKIFLVVLILLALLFAVGVILGATRSDAAPEDPERTPSGFETTLGGLFRSLRPTAKLPAKEFACGTSTSAPASDASMRTVKLRLSAGCAVVIRYDCPVEKKDSELDHQKWPPDDRKPKDKQQTSLVILKEGGKITFEPCTAHKNAACKVVVVED